MKLNLLRFYETKGALILKKIAHCEFLKSELSEARKREKKFLSRIQNGNGKIQMCLFFVGAGRHPNV